MDMMPTPAVGNAYPLSDQSTRWWVSQCASKDTERCSSGGIILKRALVICHNQSLESKGDLRDILVSTHAVLFFGTPHFGVESTTFLEGINRVLSLYMETTDAILKDLQSHSPELENIQKDWVAASEKISSTVPHQSAVIAGDRNATTIVLHTDHRNLVRFSSKENDDYKTVHFYLKDYVNTAPEAIREKWVREDDFRNIARGEPTSERAIVQSKAILDNLDKTAILQLPLVSFVQSSVHNTCLEGTRKAVLQTICDWADDNLAKPIFWLCDIPGSGKSTVAMTAMESWQKGGKLGGRFFFSIASNDASTTEKLCSMLARDLVQYIPELTSHVSQAVVRNPSIMGSSFNEQFQVLVAGPIQHQQGRVILVIDAVDECKSGPQRRQLLNTLSTAVQECKNLRIFMTSRPDPVIEAVLGPLSIKSKMEDRLHNVSHGDNIDDIALYIHQSLNQVLSEDKRQRLVGKANGLFIWASTACRMLNNETNLNAPEDIYDRLISLEEPGAIDEVYDLVFERTDKESYTVLCHMLALLLVAFEPLTMNDMEDLVARRRSVLSLETGTNLIQFRHPTLVEYLRRRSVPPTAASWCVRCLKSRTEGLKFNICRIETSFYLNRQISDLEVRVSKFIPRRLRYASSNWLFHVSGTDDSRRRTLENEFRDIIQSPYVLYWMEVLSLTRGVPRATAGLRALGYHVGLQERTKSRISDIRRCLIAFSVPIQDSAPHVYISALPFTPRSSILRNESLSEYSGALSVTRGLEDAYPGLPRVLRGHEGSVNAIAFSPDGSRVVSCSDDQTIRLWYADTGEQVGRPLRGHSDLVRAVAFSPDGSQVVSGSEDDTIRLWDANTGEQVGESLRGHSDSVFAVAFSPGGS
ncbi:SubName: Full=Related to WD40-repeat protein (Notchless protein) {ECO:0000313/EMBL:CCA75486.1} [Serendipita indica DSM 11827]|nr:SubName: Full=Related to WD40-repeat protein (Notchless protein) {ECO:0000313/EMBL:CCA75486.1} [Serendipita indica DSM 11827]